MTGRIALEVALLLALVLANGAFALAEMAFVSARRARLAAQAARGDRRAAAALAVLEHPERFLSTTQIGITLIGILAGALGGATLAEELGARLDRWPPLAGRGEPVAFVLVVLAISFLSLVLGELVPKRLALAHAEAIARVAARPMRALEKVAAPAIWLLARSTRFVCRLFGLRDAARSQVSEEEIRVLVAEAATTGVLGRSEQLLVERVFRLGDLRVAELMTPRPEIAWLDLSLPAEEQMAVLAASPHARLPAARGELDRVEGIVRVRLPLAERVRAGVPSPDPTAGFVVKPTYVPETVGALAALERLGAAPSRMLLVLDEHGALQGLVTESDLVGRLAVDIAPGLADEPRVERRADGSLLVDGLLPLVDLKRLLGVDEFPQEARGAFRTLAGFVLSRFGRMPSPGDRFEWGGWRFEVVDLDGRRIDKVLVTRPGAGETA